MAALRYLISRGRGRTGTQSPPPQRRLSRRRKRPRRQQCPLSLLHEAEDEFLGCLFDERLLHCRTPPQTESLRPFYRVMPHGRRDRRQIHGLALAVRSARCGRDGTADMPALGAGARESVRVRIPPPALDRCGICRRSFLKERGRSRPTSVLFGSFCELPCPGWARRSRRRGQGSGEARPRSGRRALTAASFGACCSGRGGRNCLSCFRLG